MWRSASLALRHCPPLASSAIRNMRFRNAVAATSRCGFSSLCTTAAMLRHFGTLFLFSVHTPVLTASPTALTSHMQQALSCIAIDEADTGQPAAWPLRTRLPLVVRKGAFPLRLRVHHIAVLHRPPSVSLASLLHAPR